MGSVAKLRIFEEMKSAITLTAIKVNASDREREAAVVRANWPGSCPSILFGTSCHALRLTPVTVNPTNEELVAAIGTGQPGFCMSSLFETSRHALRLNPVRVDAWTRTSATGAGKKRSIPKRSASSQDLGPDRTARVAPVTVYARPALHLFQNTQSQGCNPREARS